MSKLIGVTFHYEDGSVVKARANDIVVNVGGQSGSKYTYLNADECPVHGPWKAVPAGSKGEKSWVAFWSCDTARDEPRCTNKPAKEWFETHPPERVLPHSNDSSDFDDLPF